MHPLRGGFSFKQFERNNMSDLVLKQDNGLYTTSLIVAEGVRGDREFKQVHKKIVELIRSHIMIVTGKQI